MADEAEHVEVADGWNDVQARARGPARQRGSHGLGRPGVQREHQRKAVPGDVVERRHDSLEALGVVRVLGAVDRGQRVGAGRQPQDSEDRRSARGHLAVSRHRVVHDVAGQDGAS